MDVSPRTTLASTAAKATEKEAFRSRQGELHRLFNNRKGCFGATNKKNVEANDRAYDMNQKKKTGSGHFGRGVQYLRVHHEEGDCG